ncbi:hypothetical protein IEQ34_007155 [Dendrobium chrysotoxum]|uniref:Transducin/WD40 repeat-like superfamily protein n=1 Tax=Dendrobium chrysotoxum TaxID=161865 RepID=A0AAV7GSB4_DENCH|nr:hypothetical protein IEQ34_007155 [Dendrobium chrysotoxum]
MLEWATVQHLDLRHVGRGLKPLQPHAAVFHPTQAVVAVAIGTYILEFDALTGSKISSIDIGARVVRMAYSPTSGHTVISILEDCTIRACDFDCEQTLVLHSPEKRTEQISVDAEVHLALTPLQPVVFFGFHRRMSVTVVGTVEGGRPPTRIKTDLKKPIVNIACHPRLPVLYVSYADGLIRAYNIQTYAVHYTLQLENTTKLVGAGSFAFHPTLEWIFVGDRSGSLLAWDVSTERPNMIGITQAGSHPITSIAWLPSLRLLVTVSRDGVLQLWKTHVMINPNRQPMQANFFEHAAIEAIDITRILSQKGGEPVYPLPRVKNLAVHPKLNLAALVFTNMPGGDKQKNRAAYTREGRKQLFTVLQSARGSTAAVLKEKLSALGSSGILADHQLQAELQEQQLKGRSQVTMSDIARKAFLHSHFMEGHAKSGPISRLPLIMISDANNLLKDVPVCVPFHLELNFFNKENRVLQYPGKVFYLDGFNLMAYNLSTGAESLCKKLYSTIPGNVECLPKHMLYSSKQHLFFVVFELIGTNGSLHEVVIHRELTDDQLSNNKGSLLKGRDAALLSANENQYAILDEDRSGLALYVLPGPTFQEVNEHNGAIDGNSSDGQRGSDRGPHHFIFETAVDRIFSFPLESTILYSISGDHIGLAKLLQSYHLSTDDGRNISTKTEGKKFINLKRNEHVHWQETPRGHVAGILTSHRVLICSTDLEILSSTLLGALNDRLMFANPTEINPRQKKGVEIRSCLVGLLEPLLIGFATMQQQFEQKIDLPEVLYQITSRFDSLRITPRSLDILANGSPVCGDLALSLSQACPHFTQVLRCIYAIKALRFSTALSILKDEYLRSRDFPQCPPTSHLFHRFRQLGYACIKYGQFDSAKETFEVISDFESMLDLFICHLNPSALRHLSQKLEDAATDLDLRRYCERILRVRSTGWGQGIFANFAAESMVPKGPEWGGGNWEIKTPVSMKDIPQWELAGEVMPYMKTSEGGIPTIIADQIGVYLGVVRGKGNIVEVSETSLIKAFTASINENKSSNSDLLPNLNKEGPNGIAKANPVVDILTKQLVGAAPKDEQAKAEEEFKKSLYGTVDVSSSEEDEATSKNKKIRIRIRDKPIDGPTVDVNKIKEATKQFRLGDAPMRTRSGGSQDISLVSSQPSSIRTAAAASPAIDMFGNDTSIPTTSMQTNPMITGMGVSAGPIPEDFFKNTIPSFEVAASLPPPGTYLSKMEHNSQVMEGNRFSSNREVMTNVGFHDGGVPPQVYQQTGVPLEAISLPDGGIPPQSQAPAIGPPTLMPMPSQPVDLSYLEIPGSNTTAAATKPSPTPSTVPTSVAPGHVPRGAPAAICFKTGLAHLEQNQLSDALSCFDEAFLALAQDQSRGDDIKAQATICAQYKIAVALLQEIARLQKVQGPSMISAKEEMARLSRHLGSLPLLAKHRINCIRTAIKRNMEVQNYGYAKQMLDLLFSKAPPSKQDELKSLIDMCVQRGLSNKSIDPQEDPSQFCAATLSRLPTIGHDICSLCGAKFSALSAPGCIVCGMGSIKRSDSAAGPVPSPFG